MEIGNKVRTMKYMGDDFWSRPVYRCTETNQLYKDITLGSDHPDLYSCQNEFDGEPDRQIKPDLTIIFINRKIEDENEFSYMMLDRMRSDCDYYLGYGNRNKKNLCYYDEQQHIDEMKKLWNVFPDNKKPEWLTYEEILQYEKDMVI